MSAAAQSPGYSSGAAAFTAKDYPSAARLWANEVSNGSAEAAQNLGMLYDLGLGVPQDANRAFRNYMIAARAGMADAAFNVGVMLDSGTGAPMNRAAAGLWYSRAAARGSQRAQYNLGLMFAQGDGLPRNAELASYWLTRAAENLPAARDLLSDLPEPQPRELTAPLILGAFTVGSGPGAETDFVWAAEEGPVGARFAVQVARRTQAGGMEGRIETVTSDASALTLPATGYDPQWRVVRIDPLTRAYAASGWQSVTSGPAPQAPRGRVTILHNPGDARAEEMATVLSDELSANGLWVEVAETGALSPLTVSSVRYGYDTDAGLAQELAAFLPGFGADAARLAPGPDTVPGGIAVDLVFATN